MNRNVAVLAGALAVDIAFGDLPNRFHPVACLGNAIGRVDRRFAQFRNARPLLAGLMLAMVFPAAAAMFAVGLRRVARRLPLPVDVLLEAFLLKQTFSIRGLFAHAEAVRRPLAASDVDTARAAASMIVSREVSDLGPPAIASAAIESLAENSSDSVVAPLAWYVVGGLPTAYAYRAVNTLDAMVGYRKRGLVGAPSAKLDDVLNYVPARVTAASIALAGGLRSPAIRASIGNSRQTPSPNSGWPMAFAAHALGVRLEKRGHHVLNADEREPNSRDIRRAENLVARALGICCAGMLVVQYLREATR